MARKLTVGEARILEYLELNYPEVIFPEQLPRGIDPGVIAALLDLGLVEQVQSDPLDVKLGWRIIPRGK